MRYAHERRTNVVYVYRDEMVTENMIILEEPMKRIIKPKHSITDAALEAGFKRIATFNRKLQKDDFMKKKIATFLLVFIQGSKRKKTDRDVVAGLHTVSASSTNQLIHLRLSWLSARHHCLLI